MFGFGKKKKLKVAFVTASETGLVRKDNQDSLFVDKSKTLFCVADGMGGGSEGATASRFVCEEVAKAAEDVQDLAGRMRSVDAAIAAANARIRAYAEGRNFKQMGSTVAVMLVDPEDGRHAAICHVGDSRIYRVRRACAEPLTKDHTIGGQLGELTSGIQAAGFKSRTNPLSHVLTRAIGGADKVSADWRRIDVTDGDRFLICSDGVHDVVSDRRIGALLSRTYDIDTAAAWLKDAVVDNGAPDNYTYVIAEMGGGK